MPAKRVLLDTVVVQALEVLGHDSGKSFQELAEEAFRDLLRKHRRPTTLKRCYGRALGATQPTMHILNGAEVDKAEGRAAVIYSFARVIDALHGPLL